MRKRILYTILPVCLLLMVFAGCDDNVVEPLPETVPLIVEVSGNSFVMGEEITMTVKVNDKDNPELTANEDFNVRLTALDGDKDVSEKAFKSFPSMVTFKKGTNKLEIKLKITDNGLAEKEKLTVNIIAYVRGYTIADPIHTVVIGAHHYTVLSLKNNTDNTINEGEEFTIQADAPVPVTDDTEINVSVPDGQEGFYSSTMPTSLTIKAGEKHGEVTVKTLYNTSKTKDETLTLNFVTLSETNPLYNAELEVTMKDLESDWGDRLQDERWVYETPNVMFVSAKNAAAVTTWNASAKVQRIDVGSSHPNAELAAQGWKFYTAMEFHRIDGCCNPVNTWGRREPRGFSAQNTAGIQTLAAVKNDKYSDVTGDGYLRMWTMKISETATAGGNQGSKEYGYSAFYSGKGKWAPGTYRILPGVRMEFRVRVIGKKKGFNMAIWLMGTTDGTNSWPKCGEVDILENPALDNNDNRAFQSLHSNMTADGTEDKSVTTGGINVTKMEQWNIYWFEWSEDGNTIKFGINGQTNKTITKADYNGAPWPFDLTTNPSGFYLILSQGVAAKWALPEMTPGWDDGFSSLNNYTQDCENRDLPGMEIDWMRLYIKQDKSTYQGQVPSGDVINTGFTFY